MCRKIYPRLVIGMVPHGDTTGTQILWLIILATLSDAETSPTTKIEKSKEKLTRGLESMVKNTPTTKMTTTFLWTPHRVHLRGIDRIAEENKGSYFEADTFLHQAELKAKASASVQVKKKAKDKAKDVDEF